MTGDLSAQCWRAVARHADLAASAPRVLEVLRASGTFDWLMIRRWDEERARLETVACAGTVTTSDPRSPVPTPRRDLLLAWGARDTVEVWPSREVTGIARLCVPEGVAGRVVAGPLRVDGALLGVLLLGTPDAAADAVARVALEALGVALVNDARHHELGRLREAAEQDRSALLSRLARQDLTEAVIGAGLQEVMARVLQVAPTDAPVLILGETGAGKEVVSRAIHARSRRQAGPFLRVNCGAIPTELVDSELFGHEKGSFTGAIAQRKGWFERADGGTLFLDEVAELPAAAQVRLLRVLQDGTFQRVGGQQTQSVDVRIVAATHRDMRSLVRDGQFRQDLWYRISVFPISLPALRDRPDDIPALVRHFAHNAGTRLFGRPIEVDPDDLPLLVAYDWPGNVRELASVIERAAILGAGHTLDIRKALGPVGAPAPAPAPPLDDREAIERALVRARGRIEGPFGTAAALGVNPFTLRSRLRRLGIDWSRFRE